MDTYNKLVKYNKKIKALIEEMKDFDSSQLKELKDNLSKEELKYLRSLDILKKDIRFYSKKEEYYEFNNFFPSKITIDGEEYLSVEHYYQTQKFFVEDNKRSMKYYNLMLKCDSPGKVKCLGTMKGSRFSAKWLISKQYPELGLVNDAIEKYKDKVFLRGDWEDIKEDIMYKGLKTKFKNKELRDLLLKTKELTLMENSPKDYYWGIGKTEEGKNRLGVLLMKLRKKLRK